MKKKPLTPDYASPPTLFDMQDRARRLAALLGKPPTLIRLSQAAELAEQLEVEVRTLRDLGIHAARESAGASRNGELDQVVQATGMTPAGVWFIADKVKKALRGGVAA